MMQWLTDAGRRQQTWQRRVEPRAGIRDPRAEQLPDGRLRWRYDWTDGRRDTATTARLADMARLQADQTASAIAAHFQNGT